MSLLLEGPSFCAQGSINLWSRLTILKLPSLWEDAYWLKQKELIFSQYNIQLLAFFASFFPHQNIHLLNIIIILELSGYMISNDIFQVNVNSLLIQQNCTISYDLLMLVTL